MINIKNLESYIFYKGLGLTDEQSAVLSIMTYGNHSRYAKELVSMYNNSKDRHDGLTFCESLSKVIIENDITENDIIDIVERYKKHNGVKTEEANSRLFGSMFVSHSAKSMNFAGSPSNFSRNAKLSCNPPVQNNMGMDSLDEDYSFFSMDASPCNNSIVNTAHDCAEELLCEDVEYDCSDIDTFDCSGGFGGFGGFNTGNNNTFRKKLADSLRTDKYEHISEKGFKSVLNNPTSTFRTTCNRASIDILNKTNGFLTIEKSMVKPEEMLNYFDYKIEAKNAKFSIQAEMCDKPNSKNKLLFIGIKGEEAIPSKQNVVILLDVSGSMYGEEQETQAAIMTIVSKLSSGDKFSLITYSDEDTVIIDDITIGKNSIDFIIERMLQIEISGCTFGSRGLNSAYDLIHRNYDKDGINRIVLITDGDFNFGDCSTDSIEKLILEKKKTGAFLSLIGVGSINYNDELMNTLAKNGNGSYAYVSSFNTVKENIDIGYNKLMFSIAKDVKAQIEFNPKYVKEYRLIGYENRELSHDDFKNDKVIAEPFGSAAQAVAIYEIVPNFDIKADKGLKYQTVNTVDSDELCTVSLRYKEVDFTNYDEDASSKLLEESFKLNNIEKSEMTFNLKLSYVIYIISEYLRQSNFADRVDIEIAKKYLDELINDKDNLGIEFKLNLLKNLAN